MLCMRVLLAVALLCRRRKSSLLNAAVRAAASKFKRAVGDERREAV